MMTNQTERSKRNSRAWRGHVALGALAAACLTTTSLAATAACAQTTNVDNTEVVVTALKRETTLQSTPVSVSAVSGEALRRGDVQDISQLHGVPGLSFVDAGPAFTRIVMRGIQTVGEPAVGLYYDETPVTGVVGSTSDAGGSMPALKLFDVNRVEVLRGPQGTLYGSGAMGGALKVLFNKPAPTYAAVIDASVSQTAHGGSGNLVQGMINLPIIRDKLAVRVVGFDETSAGYIDNTVLNTRNINETKAKGGRFLARLTPFENLTIDAGAFYQETHGDRPIWNMEAGPYKATNQVRLPSDDLMAMYDLTVKWVDHGLTWVGTASSSHRKDYSSLADPSYYFQTDLNNPAMCAKLRGGTCSPQTLAAFNAYVQGYLEEVIFAAQKADTNTAELRVSSNEWHGLTWTAGAFYSDRQGDDDNNGLGVDPTTALPSVPWNRQTNRLIDDQLTQSAVFAEASYKLTSRLTLTAGTRFVDYERHVGGQTVVPLDLAGAKLTPYAMSSSKENKWLSKVNLAYAYSDSVLLYAQAAQGFRPGGANQVLGLPAALTAYRSDSLWNYETGVKSRGFDNRLTVNADLYRIDWKDMQVTGQNMALGPFSFIANAGAARINGAELESNLHLGALRLSANVGYSDARLSEDQTNANITANGHRGDRVPYVPQVSGSLSGDYDYSLGQGWRGYADVNAVFVGESFSEFSPANVFYRRLPAYTSINLRIGAQSDSRGWGVSAFVDNLFDRVGIVSETANNISVGHTLVTSIAPRTVGVNVRKSF